MSAIVKLIFLFQLVLVVLTSTTNASKIKIVESSSLIPQDLKDFALKHVKIALQNKNATNLAAFYLVQQMESQFGNKWSCVIDNDKIDTKFYLKSRSYIKLLLDDQYVVLYSYLNYW